MDKTSSLPQFSLCIPLCPEQDLISEFHLNLSQFFQRFPLKYEVLFAVNPGQGQSLSMLRFLAEQNPHYRIIENKKTQSRARNLHSLFAQAQGEILIPADLDLAVPLSEILKILEVFFSDGEMEAVFGNRFKAKKNLESQPAGPQKLESFFAGILKEKTSWKFSDPFCPALGLRRSGFEKIEKDLKSSGWHWSQEVQRVVQLKNLKAQEIPIYEGARRRLPPPKSEAFYLLGFVLFRI